MCRLYCCAVPADLIERYLSPIPEASYNYVQRWDYSLLAHAMCNKGGKYKIYKVCPACFLF
jgi:TPP-dependent 2-oxoacid decarboxylase